MIEVKSIKLSVHSNFWFPPSCILFFQISNYSIQSTVIEKVYISKQWIQSTAFYIYRDSAVIIQSQLSIYLPSCHTVEAAHEL